jgi:hypothetical protein
MSQSFRGEDTSSAKTTRLDDEPLEAATEVPPWLKLGIGGMWFCFGVFCNGLQVVTSVMGILALIFGSEVGLMNLSEVTHVLGWQFFIGLVIGGGVQAFLHKYAMPLTGTLRRIRGIQNIGMKSMSAASTVARHHWVDIGLLVITLLAEFVSDLFFVRLFTSNVFVLLFWFVFLSACSTKLMYTGAIAIWGAVEDGKDYAAYHRRNDGQRGH